MSPILNRIPDRWGRYVQIAPGWHAIALELDRKLAERDPDYEVHQVKEKFGGLRYYCSLDGHVEAEPLIREAERKAAVTCEQCGQRGQLRGGSWISTLCDNCHGAP